MHGSWKLDEDIVIVALRLGTEFGWARIEAEFNKFFPNAPAVRKDIESRYNKTLKPERDEAQAVNVADVVDDYRHYRVLPANQTHAEWVRAALRVLSEYPEERIISVNPQIEGVEGQEVPPQAGQAEIMLPEIQPEEHVQSTLSPQGQLDQYTGWEVQGEQVEGAISAQDQQFIDDFAKIEQFLKSGEQPEEQPERQPEEPAEAQGQEAPWAGFYGSMGYSGTDVNDWTL